MKFPQCNHDIPPVGQTVIKSEGDTTLVQIGQVSFVGSLTYESSTCWHLTRQQALNIADLIRYVNGVIDEPPTIEGLILTE